MEFGQPNFPAVSVTPRHIYIYIHRICTYIYVCDCTHAIIIIHWIDRWRNLYGLYIKLNFPPINLVLLLSPSTQISSPLSTASQRYAAKLAVLWFHLLNSLCYFAPLFLLQNWSCASTRNDFRYRFVRGIDSVYVCCFYCFILFFYFFEVYVLVLANCLPVMYGSWLVGDEFCMSLCMIW